MHPDVLRALASARVEDRVIAAERSRRASQARRASRARRTPRQAKASTALPGPFRRATRRATQGRASDLLADLRAEAAKLDVHGPLQLAHKLTCDSEMLRASESGARKAAGGT